MILKLTINRSLFGKEGHTEEATEVVGETLKVHTRITFERGGFPEKKTNVAHSAISFRISQQFSVYLHEISEIKQYCTSRRVARLLSRACAKFLLSLFVVDDSHELFPCMSEAVAFILDGFDESWVLVGIL